MASTSHLKTSFRKARALGPIYTGGPLAVDQDGYRVVSTVGDELILTDVSTGERICLFATDGEAPSSIALCASTSASLQLLAVFTASLALHLFEVPAPNSGPSDSTIQPIRKISRAHDAPVHVCIFTPTSSGTSPLLASGSADGAVKVWDARKGYVTHAFRGHGGVVSALAFSFAAGAMRLFTACGDNFVRCFDLKALSGANAKPELILEGHVSVPRVILPTVDGRWLITAGRDSVILVWDLMALLSSTSTAKASKKGKSKASTTEPTRTIVAGERIEAAALLQPSDLPHMKGEVRIAAGGEKGVVRLWNVLSGDELGVLGHDRPSALSEDAEDQHQILAIDHNPSSCTVSSIHADQNMITYSLETGNTHRQLIGFNDEIVDATFLPSNASSEPQQLAIATNSSLIRVYATAPDALDARLLAGHRDIVLCVTSAKRHNRALLASGSKDRTARLWVQDDGDWRCAASCEGHAESVGALAISRNGRFMFTGSQDRTIKMWDLAQLDFSAKSSASIKLSSMTTQKAHERDINALDVSPNDVLVASGSQDKTVKVFGVVYAEGKRGEIKLLGTCKGHKRGVWTVKFGRTERVLATGSGDKTVRLWNLDDFSCVKTFEGHTNSVLRVDFISDSLQVLSVASDGLVKLWNIASQECVATLDNHEDKVWALAVSEDEQIVVSAGADSMITFWEDSTELEQEERNQKLVEQVQTEQNFQNFLALNDYKNAILLGLAMNQPGRLLKLFTTVRTSDDADETSMTGHVAVDEVLRKLSAPDLVHLLQHVKAWNTRAKTSAIAQGILHALLRLRTVDDLVQAFSPEVAPVTGLKELVDGLIPYSERHFARVERLVQESYTIDFLLAEMDGFELGIDADQEMGDD
ncbi:WD40 repeat-like protein [Auriculariales sp. MPI-PUGE-AT-0066]|nr:WD40 repeat-like protein [Auriculariales sp. MPI-PUGE-AT-0066]